MRLATRLIAAFAVLLAALAAGAYGMLWASLPALEGEQGLYGLDGTVLVERDALGTVTVSAGDESDAMRALGFVHAQERYFEMDLMRRAAAGELAALFGQKALPHDQQARRHRMRKRAAGFLESLPDTHRELLDAYAGGVNAGLAALAVRPWPYLLLRLRPEPWTPVDSLLVGYAMYFDLQDSENRRELGLLQLRRHLPGALVELLALDGSEWDAPLSGEPRPGLSGERLEAVVRARRRATGPARGPTLSASSGSTRPTSAPGGAPGSNNFAVSGAFTTDGRALVANDMHLGLRAPNLWFRTRLVFPIGAGTVDVVGVGLPGLPGIVVGSNGHVAWGFTNSYGDWHDFIRVHWIDRDAYRYRTPGGEERAVPSTEWIAVRGARPVALELVETRWGPILHDEAAGTSLALAWTAHRSGGLDLGLLEMAHARDIDAVLDAAHRSGLPPQNLVFGDSAGRIGWTIIGRIPDRRGDCDPLQPQEPVLEGCDWHGWLAAEQIPRLLDPPGGRIWSANSRVVDSGDLALLGDGGYDLGARQRQIREWLQAHDRFDEAALLAIQLDDRAIFLERWWRLLREEIERSKDGGGRALAALEPATRHWEGRAEADAVAYRLTRAFRGEVLDRFVDGLVASAQSAEGDAFVRPHVPQIEALLWPAASGRLDDWLPEGYPGWPALFEAAAAAVVGDLDGRPGGLAARSWGERNTAMIRHPMASALPAPLAARLSMPRDAMSGDAHMPRVQGPAFGASQRMVVAPGRENDGILHMPGGQSGHPLSPFWGSGHQDWVEGRPTPLLPGATLHRLELRPVPVVGGRVRETPDPALSPAAPAR